MNQYLIDLKATLFFFITMIIQFSNIEIAMKVIMFIITLGYTVYRWYLLYKNRKE